MSMRANRPPRPVTSTALTSLVTLALASAPTAGQAYQHYGVRIGTGMVVLKWQQMPVRYYVTDAASADVSATGLRDAIGRAFSTWQSVKTASVQATFVGFTDARPGDDDGMSTLGFDNRPDLDRVLGSTNFLVDTVTGEIIESDIFFNSAFTWSVAAGGETGHYDLETIALHEIGHLLGLGHSALGETEVTGTGRRVLGAESVMFPIAFSPGNVSDRTLRADDVAGISDLYPAAGFREASSTITGQVTKNGQGVYGAHVVAFNPATGKLVGNFSYDRGSFSIAGLDPGVYVLRVEPLDDADPNSFFDDPTAVDVDFRIAYLQRLVPGPAGGSSGSVSVQVESKK